MDRSRLSLSHGQTTQPVPRPTDQSPDNLRASLCGPSLSTVQNKPTESENVSPLEIIYCLQQLAMNSPA